MALNYTTFYTEIANLMPVSTSDSNYATMLPGAIDYAEQRIYRDLDLLYTQTTVSSMTVSSGDRNFTITGSTVIGNPGTFITVDNFNIIIPASATSSNGSRVPLVPTSPEFIDNFYPSNSSALGVPEYYAMRSLDTIILGPAPDASYTTEIIGIQRPAALSASNSSTFLTRYLPDLFRVAAMVYVSGYMRDFGPMADDPKMGQSWENQYQLLMKSASVEQLRSKFASEAWTSEQPSPIATPPRV